MTETEVGSVIHFFSKISVAIIRITADSFKVGDSIYIKGHSTDIKQGIDSMQIEHKIISEGKVGDEVGIKVTGHVREGDKVYKVTE